MTSTVGRRGFLRMIAGAVAGAVVATKVVEHVAADAPAPVSLPEPAIGKTLHPYQEKFWGQENLRFAPAVRGRHSSMYFPKGDQGQTLTTSRGAEWKRRLEPATDELKLAYGWGNTFILAENLCMTMDEARERFTAEEVDWYAALVRSDAPTITIK